MKKCVIYLLLAFMTIINVNASEPITYNISSNHIKMTVIADNVIIGILPDDVYNNIKPYYILSNISIDETLKMLNDLYNELMSFDNGRTIIYKAGEPSIHVNLMMLYNEYDEECFYIKTNGTVYTLSKSDLKKLQKKLIKHHNKFNKI